MTENATNSDSVTVVNFCLDEPRKTVGFKCNERLWKAFVLHCKANYGSVCHVLEPIIVALLTSQVNQSKTLKPLHIENLNVERAVKRVRRYAVESVEETETGSEVCALCGKAAVVATFSSSGSQFLCRKDLEKAKPHVKGWRYIKNE